MWRLSNRYLFSKMLSQFHFHIHEPHKSRLSKNIPFEMRFLSDNGERSFRNSTINTSISDGFYKHKQGFIPLKVLQELDIQGASLNENKNILHLIFVGGEKLDFPVIWLRDNCQCSNCFDVKSHSRTVDQQILKNNTLPQSIYDDEFIEYILFNDKLLRKSFKFGSRMKIISFKVFGDDRNLYEFDAGRFLLTPKLFNKKMAFGNRIFSSLLCSLSIVKTTQNNVVITWEDGHKSEYNKKWLCQHSFVEEHQKDRCKKRHLDQICWNSEEFEKNKSYFKFVFSDILHDDLTLLNWLEKLAKYGLSIIADTPKSSGQLERLAERIAFIRKTHYGEQFSVTGSDNAENVAYKKGALQLHTDLPYYHFMPGIVMLHCIKPSVEGGENILSDGFNAASQLSVKAFQVLSETIVDWMDVGSHENKRFYSINREPVLCLNRFGKLDKINWSQPQRDSIFNVSVQKAIEWYAAAAEFSKIIHNKKNAVIFKSQIGDILTFDNRRILHGRKHYSDANRLLYGAYIDWDEIYSRIRVLQNELKPDNQ